jgi:XTP/dITP diphosphohydrolase
MKNQNELSNSINRLSEIMDKLRIECPWDREQTMDSLRHLTIEETFELSDAIIRSDSNEIKNELGDLLLHIVFYSKIASETDLFDFNDVINSICDKLITRHPHIYDKLKVNNITDVKKNWELIKIKQGSKGVLSGVSSGLPSLIKAMRIQEKVSGVGFKWDKPSDYLNKLIEEINEFEIESNKSDLQKMENEFGDILFSLISYASFKNINCDKALEITNNKFIDRFNSIEKNNSDLYKMSQHEFLKQWQKSKK